MSNRLTVLPSEHPCGGCQHSCCSPVTAGFTLDYPLSADDFRQRFRPSGKIRKFIESLKGQTRIAAVKKLKAVIPDSRFSVRGIFVKTDNEAIYDGSQTSFEIGFVRTLFIVLLDCSSFDREAQVCLDYDNRPDLCVDFDVAACGRSSLSNTFRTQSGAVVSRQELIATHREIEAKATPQLDDAIQDLEKRIKVKFD